MTPRPTGRGGRRPPRCGSRDHPRRGRRRAGGPVNPRGRGRPRGSKRPRRDEWAQGRGTLDLGSVKGVHDFPRGQVNRRVRTRASDGRSGFLGLLLHNFDPKNPLPGARERRGGALIGTGGGQVKEIIHQRIQLQRRVGVLPRVTLEELGPTSVLVHEVLGILIPAQATRVSATGRNTGQARVRGLDLGHSPKYGPID